MQDYFVQNGTAHTGILALKPPQRARGAVKRQLRCDVKLTGDARRMAGQLEHVLNIEHKGKPRAFLLTGKAEWLPTRLADVLGARHAPRDPKVRWKDLCRRQGMRMRGDESAGEEAGGSLGSSPVVCNATRVESLVALCRAASLVVFRRLRM